jgi:phospholipid/cholesterol/gamma-HCH transport system substrate-binding protein
MREVSPKRALINAAVAALVVVLAVWGAIQVARRHWHWQPTYRIDVAFPRIGGLAVGDKVRLQGMDAGVVEAIEAPRSPGGPIVVVLRVDARLRPLIRSDASVSIAVQNAVGPKVVEIAPGRPDAPPLAEGATLRAEPPVELGDLLLAGQDALKQLEGVTRETEVGIRQINVITAAIGRGEGTLGKLVRDDAAYHEVVALAERGQRAIGALDDNMSALKGLWPLSGYFRDRGYDEPERILYRPNATRDSRVLASDTLFRPDSAILTDTGRAALDELARWFKARRWTDASEVVIAAFTDEADADKARILTQDQARAVKTYLDEKHKLFELPLFRQRKVAAVGFGNRTPRPDPSQGATAPESPPPARRVEFVVFAPKP